MDFHVAFENLEKKFTSGNSIPVSRSVITSEEWQAIKWELEQLEEWNTTLLAKLFHNTQKPKIYPANEETMKYIRDLIEDVSLDNYEGGF